MNTDPSMGLDTTGGALALLGSEPAGNAPIIDKVTTHRKRFVPC